jgi:hypothetical protein
VADVHEVGHGRDIAWTLRAKQAPEPISEAWIGTSWIVEVTVSGTRDGRPFQATHLFLTSLRTTPEALLQLVRDRWSLEGWHWIRDTQLHEDAHRYRGNGAGVMATLRTAALNLLRLAGFRSIRAGLQAVMHVTSRHFWRWRGAGRNPARTKTLNQPWPGPVNGVGNSLV